MADSHLAAALNRLLNEYSLSDILQYFKEGLRNESARLKRDRILDAATAYAKAAKALQEAQRHL